MDLKHYLENTSGFGILATADEQGRVDQAIYAKPHVIDDHTVVFVMCERLSHLNLKSNLYACYMYIEDTKAWTGKRLYLQKTHEETNTTLVQKMIAEHPEICPLQDDSEKYMVFFQVQRVRALIGE